MMIKNEKNYKFYVSSEVSSLLFRTIKKLGKYRWDRKRNRKNRIDWDYNSEQFTKNPALIFGKMIPYAQGKDKNENKGKYLELVANEMTKLNKELKIIEKIKYRIETTVKALSFSSRTFQSPISWRMVIGLGASHPQETSMTLHHIYGIPYIPGSAVKGVTRHGVIWEKFKGDEEKALKKDEDFKNIFGTPDQSGKIIFFDAYPVNNINLKVDVMTPHYPKYYSKEIEPADWHPPTPIKFLTVDKTSFQFYLACKKENENLLEKALMWLKESLSNFGIGAKTSIGYGYFDIKR